MIRDRLALMIIYFILSSFNTGDSWAANLNLSKTNIISEKTPLQPTFIDLKKNSYELKSTKIDDLWSKPKLKKANSPERSLNSNPISQVDRFWALGAMTLISAIALFLIWILFSKPKQKYKAVTNLPPVNKAHNCSKVTVSYQTLAIESDPRQNDRQDVAITKPVLNIALDNSLAVEKSTVKNKVNQANSLANIDKLQQFINTLRAIDNCHEPVSAQTELKRQAIWHLAKVENYYSVEPLLKVMPQVGVLAQNLILEAVMQINQHSYQSINNQLFVALHHENPEVRLKALRDLRNLYQFVSPIITKIAQMQSDQDYEVSQSAILILRQLNANPLPTFYDDSQAEVDNLVVKESEENLDLAAYLLAELDTEK
ncbi:hypothetical protein C7B62_13480 [Pleurocapsa sp. CCALA 161]|uniref:hypothetical protein n=1 Tax=Pleurocapsa sp. CCALA 161 TaxID=2107688 RepID=UPI000D077485|nr:hypothetical protein [Pleurocapsa sp. CCALA 161]PSB09383.1 hypothetical protein C7B62_13480 [Pleurocapsa sp. CCALA 161]